MLSKYKHIFMFVLIVYSADYSEHRRPSSIFFFYIVLKFVFFFISLLTSHYCFALVTMSPLPVTFGLSFLLLFHSKAHETS